jgi:heme/copper-type cytochrome/quinol oxidase subunit 4
VVSAPALRLAAAIQMLVDDLYFLHKQVDELRRTQ